MYPGVHLAVPEPPFREVSRCSLLQPVAVLQLLGEVGFGEVLEAESGEGLDLGFFPGLDHELQFVVPRSVLLDKVLLGRKKKGK